MRDLNGMGAASEGSGPHSLSVSMTVAVRQLHLIQGETDPARSASCKFLSVEPKLLSRLGPVPDPMLHVVHDEQVPQFLNLREAVAVGIRYGGLKVQVPADMLVPPLQQTPAQVRAARRRSATDAFTLLAQPES